MNLVDRIQGALPALGVRDGDRLGVACSGGADSVALLHILDRSSVDVRLAVVHVDHGLRPDSGADATFVRDLAARLDLPCRVLEVTVDRRSRLGAEAAARRARYAALDEAAADLGLRWIATAHTLDDQAETVLLRAVRGGSLGGIRPVHGIFVRPLLDVERAELRSWLSSEGIGWREDPTNADVRIERNWMRTSILPPLRERRPGVAKVLSRLATTTRADEEVLDALAADVLSRAEIDDAGVLLRSADLDPLPGALGTRVIRSALRRAGADPHWTDMETIAALNVGGHAPCGGTTVWRLPQGLAILNEPPPVPAPVALPDRGTLEAVRWGIRLRVGSPDAPAWKWRSAVPGGTGNLMLRSRVAGDRVPTRSGTRKVQDVLVDAKVPRPLRDFVPVISRGSGALAVVGHSAVPGPAELVVDAEPSEPSWTKALAWNASS